MNLLYVINTHLVKGEVAHAADDENIRDNLISVEYSNKRFHWKGLSISHESRSDAVDEDEVCG